MNPARLPRSSESLSREPPSDHRRLAGAAVTGGYGRRRHWHQLRPSHRRPRRSWFRFRGLTFHHDWQRRRIRMPVILASPAAAAEPGCCSRLLCRPNGIAVVALRTRLAGRAAVPVTGRRQPFVMEGKAERASHACASSAGPTVSLAVGAGNRSRASDKGRSCSVKTAARPASALNHYYNDSEAQFCSRRPARMGAWCIAERAGS